MNNGASTARKPRVYGLAYASLNYYYHSCTKVVGRGTNIAASRRSPIVKSFRIGDSMPSIPRVDQGLINIFLFFSSSSITRHYFLVVFRGERERVLKSWKKGRGEEGILWINLLERWKGSTNIENNMVTRRVIIKFWKVAFWNYSIINRS